ncbi:hypothetical protein DFR29_11721 [Tahibacter aquaticus]|uniref:Uncharacterized protein n=2 Tax=Tahibacter aquaticus TaxID=520092 RepID=A0A4R6YNB0_9GAMM|nr:hypothetical protein DFR29_11721 [Tahibacter aquaticus]
MYAMARQFGASSQNHIVWNPANGAIRIYRNYCGSAPNAMNEKDASVGTEIVDVQEAAGAGCTLQTDELSVPAELSAVAADMSQIWHATGGSFKRTVSVVIAHRDFNPPYVGSANRPSAHDFLSDMVLRTQILDLSSTPEIFQTAMPELAGPAVRILANTPSFVLLAQEVVFTITLVFYDGSKITVKSRLGENAVYVDGSAKDSTGHPLPEYNAANRYVGNWYYAPGHASDMSAFIEYMRSLGIRITGTGSGAGVIACTWDPTNGTVCVLPQ